MRTERRANTWCALWSVVLAVAMLGPALGHGFVLTYDMVWVPDLAIRPDVWGLGSGLPRAVPSDGVVALLDEVVPGVLLQKLMLVGALVAGGTGAARLVPGAPGDHLAGRLVAVSAYQWTPLVAERLGLGAWPVLVAHGLLPWLVLLGRRWRETGRLPRALLVLVPLGCLSASAGLATAVVLLAAVAGSRGLTLRAMGMIAAGNAPWIVMGLLHAADATSDRAGAEAFALRGHGVLPTPLEALTLGGTWNAEVVLPSRDGPLAWLGVVLVVSLLLGLRGWWAAAGRREALALVVPWSIGMVLALLTWAAPGVVAAVAANVPGGGLVRDGARALVLCAPLVAVLAGHVASRVTARVSDLGPRAVLAAALALVPVMLMPDASLGLAGRLDAVDYPASYAEARQAASSGSGDALVLPLTTYRQPAWNNGRKVLDPMPRWLTVDVVASDRLVIGQTVLEGEDPRVVDAELALAEQTPAARADALAQVGIGIVVRDKDAGEAPEIAGRVLLDDDAVLVLALDAPRQHTVPMGWNLAAVGAWGAFGAGPILALALALSQVVTARRRDRNSVTSATA